MTKERLFDDILKGEDVILWAGAGLSRYAGYPMGVDLVSKMYDTLLPDEKNTISKILKYHPEFPDGRTPSLPEFTQALKLLDSGKTNRLYRLLRKFFHEKPKSTKTHEQIAAITQFSNIITTNYDKLFEETQRNCNVITNLSHIQLSEPGQKNIYKIHGSLDNPTNVIITSDNYIEFSDNVEPEFWNHIKALMMNKIIIFIGYAVEDSNVRAIMWNKQKQLGDIAKPSYIVSPGIKQEHIREDLVRHNLYHIEMSGEEFIEELVSFLNKKSSMLTPPIKIIPNGSNFETGLYASAEVKEKLRQPSSGRFFAIDDSVRLIELDLKGYSETDSDYLEVICRMHPKLIIKPEVMNPSTEDLYLSIEHFDAKINQYLKNEAAFRYIEPNQSKPIRKSEWKIGLNLVELSMDKPEKRPQTITVQPLTYLATELFNRRIIRAKAEKHNGLEHNYTETIRLYEEYTSTVLSISEPITPTSYEFIFPSQLFVELAVITSDKKIMLVRKRAGDGAGVVAEIDRAWTCGPEIGLTFKHLRDKSEILLHDAIVESLEDEFGVPSDKLKSWHIKGLCIALAHLNTALYGYCEVNLTGKKLIECFYKRSSKQFDMTVKPELINLSQIPEELDREGRHDGLLWHPTAKIRLYSILKRPLMKK